MPTENDYRLQPENDAHSKVICNYCGTEIGDVYVARQTPTGRATGRSEEDVALDVQQMVREHLPQCEQKENAANPAGYRSSTPNTPPQTGPLPHQR